MFIVIIISIITISVSISSCNSLVVQTLVELVYFEKSTKAHSFQGHNNKGELEFLGSVNITGKGYLETQK